MVDLDLARESEQGEVFVPGRLCLLGEHSDWAAGVHRLANPALPLGYCIVCATNEGLYARVSGLPTAANATLRYEHIDCNHEVHAIEVDLADADSLLRLAREGGFFSYVCGTAHHMLPFIKARQSSLNAADGRLPGVLISNYKTTLPMKKGLSSSAAICVLVAKSLSQFYDLQLDRDAIMDCAFHGEILTGVKCGRMDQAVAMGAGRIGLMEFNGNSCVLSDVPVGAALHFVVADLRRGKDTAKILADLNACFPYPQTDVQRMMHKYVENNVRLSAEAVAAISAGDATKLSKCMRAAQDMFDACATDNCPDQLTSPRLHEIINDPLLRKSSLAVKGVGSQGDGSCQVLCAGLEEQQQSLARLLELGCDGFLLTIPASL